MRRIALGLAMLLGACGGHVEVGGASDASVDDTSGVDVGGGVDGGGGVDTGGGACGVGPCTPGATCKADCNTCTCSAGGLWLCTLLGCPPPCPPSRPVEGSACTSFGQTCPYVNDCKTTDLVTCTVDASGVAQWRSSKPTCVGADCPATEPTEGKPCTGPATCTYKGTCGPDTAVCGATKSYWAIERTGCGADCPATEPKVGDPCLAGGKCSYTSSCGGHDTVFCEGSGRVISIEFGTCPACPATEPTPLSPCPSPLDCKYKSSCGGTDEATCSGSGSKWTVLRGDCPP